MRILLYEPKGTGHRRTILRYVEKVIRGIGWEPIVCTTDWETTRTGSLGPLVAAGKSMEADLIHVLTADACIKRWAVDFSILRNRTIPIVCNYYLFNNLYRSVAGLAWDSLHWRGLADRVLISDDYFDDRVLPPWRNYIRFIPDPWDPAEFPLLEQKVARDRVGVGNERFIALLFGDLSPRKGIGTVLEAAEILSGHAQIQFLLAGSVFWQPLSEKEKSRLERLTTIGTIILHDRFVDEDLLSAYFCAANVVLCPYPRSFSVSSNTFTRACAAGVPCITAAHGNLGRYIKDRNLGLCYSSENAASLAAVLQEAWTCTKWRRDNPELLHRLKIVAQDRTLDVYGRALSTNYQYAVNR